MIETEPWTGAHCRRTTRPLLPAPPSPIRKSCCRALLLLRKTEMCLDCRLMHGSVLLREALVSGRPQDPWLAPDVCDYLRSERDKGLPAAIVAPIGFVCDHIEVLYDLDTEAAQVCRDIGLPMERAEAVNDDPLFLDMMADVVLKTVSRYQGGRALAVRPPS